MRLDDDQLDDLADRIADRLRSAPRDGLVDAQQLADHLGVARSFVYTHADELGGKRLGDRGRLRFDVATATAAFAGRQPEHPTPTRRRRPRTADGNVGSILKVRA